MTYNRTKIASSLASKILSAKEMADKLVEATGNKHRCNPVGDKKVLETIRKINRITWQINEKLANIEEYYVEQ